MIADIFPVAHQHAAKILRPRAVHRRADDHLSDMAGAQLLRIGWKREEGVDLTFRKKLQRIERGVVAGDPMNVVSRIETHLGSHQGEQQRAVCCHFFPLELGNAANLRFGDQLVTADMYAGEDDDRSPGIDRLIGSIAKPVLKSASPRPIAGPMA